ncbi:sarcosine oxidase subunit gamma [Aestuariivirga sp.]|uniref:sarcosine oxidase subunit gamma n=1 Tax=Aestuariivirga sp. TaxID=2650926 RepID=UPI0025BDD84F|nr:sarcosine oxidase subunit gamma family protein [Aestuariivirga sp.]MCA3555887.1 sarcosine oxidase subunit gamma [Aestuariivirga sp.]
MPETAHMTERTFSRVSPLQDVAVQGRFGADKGVPGVTFSVRHPMSVVTVIARAGQAQAAAAALKAYEAQWAGPGQWFVLAGNRGEGALYRELRANLAGLASVSDQSHGRVIIRLAGPRVRAVLAKGTPVDLHPDAFPVGRSALTQMAHVGVHLTRVGADSYDVSVFRGFSESFWEWITEQAEEFGYQVI